MTAVLVRLKVQDMVAWQWLGCSWPPETWPVWVDHCTAFRNGELFHIRKSGDQRINLTDWLVRDFDGGIVFYTDDELQRKFDFQGAGR